MQNVSELCTLDLRTLKAIQLLISTSSGRSTWRSKTVILQDSASRRSYGVSFTTEHWTFFACHKGMCRPFVPENPDETNARSGFAAHRAPSDGISGPCRGRDAADTIACSVVGFGGCVLRQALLMLSLDYVFALNVAAPLDLGLICQCAALDLFCEGTQGRCLPHTVCD